MMKINNKLSLTLIALTLPFTAVAGTAQSWSTTPKIVILPTQEAEPYKVQIAYSGYDECKLSDGSIYRCKIDGESFIAPLTQASKINMLLSTIDNFSHFELSTLVVYQSQAGDLQNCDILNYSIAGKNQIVVNVDKFGCQVS